MKAKNCIFDSMKQCAAALHVPLAKLRRAKALGCPAFANGRVDRDALLSWLAARKKAKDAPPQPTIPADPQSPAMSVTGPEGTYLRLSQEELTAFAELQTAIKAGDPEVTEGKRAAWLHLVESLRKSDLALEATRKGAAFVLKSEVEEQLERLGALLRISFDAPIPGLAVALAGCGDVVGARIILQKFGLNAQLLSQAGALLEGMKISPWLLDAIGRDIRDETGTPPEIIERWRDAISEVAKHLASAVIGANPPQPPPPPPSAVPNEIPEAGPSNNTSPDTSPAASSASSTTTTVTKGVIL
jgi:hypothetical protein